VTAKHGQFDFKKPVLKIENLEFILPADFSSPK
jgi:hypothetical protein